MRIPVLEIALVIGALLACKAPDDKSGSTSSGANTASKPKEPEIKITAAELVAEYKANEARADAKFKGKLIELSGTVEGVDSDLMDKPVVKLAGGEMFQSVHLNDVAKDVAVNLNKGDAVTFICTGNGEIIGSPMMRQCQKK